MFHFFNDLAFNENPFLNIHRLLDCQQSVGQTLIVQRGRGRAFYRHSRYLSGLFHDIIREGSLFIARSKEDKTRILVLSYVFTVPTVNNVVFESEE